MSVLSPEQELSDSLSMVTDEHRKENLSRAFVQAIAAGAGVSISIGGRSHDYGVDGSFYRVSIRDDKRTEDGTSIDFQLKATTNFMRNDNVIRYELETRTYNMLWSRGQQKCMIPAILILLCLPKAPVDWLSLSHENLILKHCCYWVGAPSKKTENAQSVTIAISKGQLLTPKELIRLLGLVHKGKGLGGFHDA